VVSLISPSLSLFANKLTHAWKYWPISLKSRKQRSLWTL
jgi:hypothetical protein